ncbi:MAG: NAD-dependent epimerase/dehydratase family protein, partial [Pseudonocardiaceae bacterium]
AIDHAIGSYAAAHGIAAVSLRYFNVAGAYGRYGERHTTETHLIPLVLQVALGHRAKIMIFGTDWPTLDGTAVRDYIHVVDLADAHELALTHAVPGEHRIYNLGNGTGYSVQQVVDTCRQVTGHPIPAQPAARRPGDPAVLIASSDRARTELGWKPERAELTAIVADAWEFAVSRG